MRWKLEVAESRRDCDDGRIEEFRRSPHEWISAHRWVVDCDGLGGIRGTLSFARLNRDTKWPTGRAREQCSNGIRIGDQISPGSVIRTDGDARGITRKFQNFDLLKQRTIFGAALGDGFEALSQVAKCRRGSGD